ncbi:cytochrome P450 [Mycena epipterygia]|nr:cytochrome P450 [Mycena epipterygia]
MDALASLYRENFTADALSTVYTNEGLHPTARLTSYVLGLVVVLLVARNFTERHGHKLTSHLVPMPGGAYFLWGHQRVIRDKSVGVSDSGWLKQFNTTVVRIRAALWLVLADPAAVAYVMNKKIYDYPHSDVSQPRIKRMLGESLGWVEGESEHKRMQNLVSPNFSYEAIKRGSSHVFSAAATMTEYLDSVLQSGTAPVTVDIFKIMQQATLDAMARFAFAYDFGGGRTPEAEGIMDAWGGMVNVATSLRGFYKTKGSMLIRRFPFLNHLPLAVIESQGNVRKTIQAGIAQELMRRNEALISPDDNTPGDLLSELLKAHKKDIIPRQELMDHVVMFTSVLPAESNYSPLISVEEELRKFPDPRYEDIQSGMPYLDATVREILRLHPPVPYMERTCKIDDVIPLKFPFTDRYGKTHTDIKVGPEQTVIIPIHTINRLDSVWGDGSVFRPERWIDGPLPPRDLLAGRWSSILTFSDGPRTCVGYRLAVFEMKVFIWAALKDYQYFDAGVELTHRYASTTNPLVIGREDEGPLLPIRIAAVDPNF